MGYWNSKRNFYEEIDPPNRDAQRAQKHFLFNLPLQTVILVVVPVVLFASFQTVALLHRREGKGGGGLVLGDSGLPPISSEVIIQLGQGSALGKVNTSRAGREYLAFLGIPYAKPPLASLRFEVRTN